MKRFMNHSLYFLFLLSCSMGCSRIELATSWADAYIHRELDRYFDMDSMQSHFVKKSLKEDVLKIRQKIFPKLAVEFQKILSEINHNNQLSGDDVGRFESALKAVFYDGLKVFDESAVEFVSQLRAEQARNFRDEFNKHTRDLKEDSATTIKSREKRYDKVLDQMEKWLGSLTSIQKKDIQKFCQENLFPIKEQIQNRDKLMNDFLGSFDKIEMRKNFVHKLFLDYESLRDPSYTKALLEDQKNYFDLIATILNKMTEEQKKHLNETVHDRIEQLKKASEKKK